MATTTTKRLNPFERYLSLWVGLCMGAGVALGLLAPALMDGLRGLEFGDGSQINIPIAILIWLMITPMMMKVDFGAIRDVGRRPRGLFTVASGSCGPGARRGSRRNCSRGSRPSACWRCWPRWS
jgi:ACR3 family arsenite efflux pump ArsB